MKSNVERQAEFRARQKAKGLKRIWTDEKELIAELERLRGEIEANQQRIVELSTELADKQAEIDRLRAIIIDFEGKTFFKIGKLRGIYGG
jgi:predicted nuclease with TOPRIM domain